ASPQRRQPLPVPYPVTQVSDLLPIPQTNEPPAYETRSNTKYLSPPNQNLSRISEQLPEGSSCPRCALRQPPSHLFFTSISHAPHHLAFSKIRSPPPPRHSGCSMTALANSRAWQVEALLASASVATPLSTELGQAFVSIPLQTEAHQVIPLYSKAFRNWLLER